MKYFFAVPSNQYDEIEVEADTAQEAYDKLFDAIEDGSVYNLPVKTNINDSSLYYSEDLEGQPVYYLDEQGLIVEVEI